MRPFACVLIAVFALAMGTAQAQLSSPMGPDGAVPAGTGAGVHSPNSPYAPIKERADVLPWSVLTTVKTKTEKNRL